MREYRYNHCDIYRTNIDDYGNSGWQIVKTDNDNHVTAAAFAWTLREARQKAATMN